MILETILLVITCTAVEYDKCRMYIHFSKTKNYVFKNKLTWGELHAIKHIFYYNNKSPYYLTENNCTIRENNNNTTLSNLRPE